MKRFKNKLLIALAIFLAISPDIPVSISSKIIVGNALGDEFEVSRLYDKHFSHEYRKASV